MSLHSHVIISNGLFRKVYLWYMYNAKNIYNNHRWEKILSLQIVWETLLDVAGNFGHAVHGDLNQEAS